MRHALGNAFFAFTLLASVTLMGSVSRAEGVRIPNPFTTGQQFLDLSESYRTAYVMGLIDGVYIGPLFDASQATVGALQQCLLGRNNRQIAAMLSKYIRDRPERWHEGANAMFYSLLFELCPGVRPK
jgi:hypothetical protein